MKVSEGLGEFLWELGGLTLQKLRNTVENASQNPRCGSRCGLIERSKDVGCVRYKSEEIRDSVRSGKLEQDKTSVQLSEKQIPPPAGQTVNCSIVRLRTRFYFWLLRSLTCSRRLRPAVATCSAAQAFIQSALRQHNCVRLRLRFGFRTCSSSVYFLICFPEGLGQTRMSLLMQRHQPCSACFPVSSTMAE